MCAGGGGLPEGVWEPPSGAEVHRLALQVQVLEEFDTLEAEAVYSHSLPSVSAPTCLYLMSC